MHKILLFGDEFTIRSSINIKDYIIIAVTFIIQGIFSKVKCSFLGSILHVFHYWVCSVEWMIVKFIILLLRDISNYQYLCTF